jgi:N-ethylmaleimide reductase
MAGQYVQIAPIVQAVAGSIYSAMDKLFAPYLLAGLSLSSRVVMAPMTRSRALGNLANPLMADYYAQRASAGLIITEGIAPAPEALGYARIPGLFSPEQVSAWRAVTEAVHAAGGRIFAQLMHTGRVGHLANLPPATRLLAPSAVRAAATIWTDGEGMQPMSEPHAMDEADLAAVRDGFVRAAENAIAAGFDGVELHGANGYLLEQFLHPHSNRRSDRYGGSPAARARYVVEVVGAVAAAVGAGRLGLRLSPHNTFNDLPAHHEVDATWSEVARGVRGLAYLHVVASPHPDFPATLAALRAGFSGPIMLNGGFDRARAQAAVAAGEADLVSFGRPFIANPDLVERLRARAPLADADQTTFYTPGEKGYVDYPRLAG